jgi:cytochrome c oxidase cbb3-type subunit I/II
MSPGSIMPPYPWLAEKTVDFEVTPAKIRAMQKLGVPYPKGFDQLAVEDMNKQADKIVAELKEAGISVDPKSQLIAMIAYLQRMGTDIKPKAETIVEGASE